MGSFWGHMDESIFFITISVWWMFHIYPEYIRKKGRTQEIKLPFSYGWPGKPHIPAEIYFKTAFPIFGFMAEFLADGFFNFKDENGNFQNLQNIQHMGIYGIFIIHGITDLFLWYGWPVVKDAHLLSVALAFAWYGIAFYFHAQMDGKEPLESMVHVLPLPVLFGAAACAVAKIVHKGGVGIPIAFTYFVFTLGTWFFHVSFLLYSVSPFPGREPSGWDRSDPRNVAFAVAMFGAHVCCNFLFMWILYVIVYVIMSRAEEGSRFNLPYEDETSKYQMLSTYDDVTESNSLDNGLVEDGYRES